MSEYSAITRIFQRPSKKCKFNLIVDFLTFNQTYVLHLSQFIATKHAIEFINVNYV